MATNDLRDFLERLPLKQSHVLEHVASTSEEKTREKIERQLNTLDLEYFCNAFRRAMRLRTKQQEESNDDDDVDEKYNTIQSAFTHATTALPSTKASPHKPCISNRTLGLVACVNAL